MQDLDWKDYWEGLEGNQRIFLAEAEDYVGRVEKTIQLSTQWRVLDFGCGFGHVAAALASKVKDIFLWDEADNMRRVASINVASRKNVHWLDLSADREFPHDLRFDLILVNSVVQYMSIEDFSQWLRRWKDMLAPGGLIVISDIIPENIWPLFDMAALLPFSARKGFLFRAVCEGLGELKRYRKMRNSRPLTRVTRNHLEYMAAEAGLKISFPRQNLTFRKQRITAIFSAY